MKLLINRFSILKTTVISLALACSTATTASELKPFASDGCSAFPDGTFEQNELWLSCCTAHDLAYWAGGSYRQRQQADELLQACVEEVGEPEIAMLMLAGVRVGGTPYLPTTFRWGYGWPYPRLYGELSDEEREQVDILLEAYLSIKKSAPANEDEP